MQMIVLGRSIAGLELDGHDTSEIRSDERPKGRRDVVIRGRRIRRGCQVHFLQY
jgi:hypothetical protein